MIKTSGQVGYILEANSRVHSADDTVTQGFDQGF
jgi:hypothetical protein